jgi:hypothetical protein
VEGPSDFDEYYGAFGSGLAPMLSGGLGQLLLRADCRVSFVWLYFLNLFLFFLNTS